MGEWIRVEDRLPGEYKDVLIYGEKVLDKPLVGHYIAEWGHIRWIAMSRDGCLYFYDKDITHWMPMPKLPGGENDG